MLMGVTILLLVNISKVPAARSWFLGELPACSHFPRRGAVLARYQVPRGPAGGRSCDPQTTLWPSFGLRG